MPPLGQMRRGDSVLGLRGLGLKVLWLWGLGLRGLGVRELGVKVSGVPDLHSTFGSLLLTVRAFGPEASQM